MTRKLVVCAATALALSFSSIASATTATVTYTMTPSTPGTVAAPGTSHFDAAIPTVVPNLGPITGTSTITYQNVVNGSPVNGSMATLDSLLLSMDFGAAGFPGPSIGLSGVVTVGLLAPVVGTWNAGVLALPSTTLQLSGTVSCAPATFCDFLGFIPSEAVNSAVSVPSPNITAGLANFQATVFHANPYLTILADPFAGNVVLSAVPEPSTLLLFGAGLVGLVAAGHRRRS